MGLRLARQQKGAVCGVRGIREIRQPGKDSRMLGFAIHFALGCGVALLIFLAVSWWSGVRQFSAPFAVVFIGFTCGLFAHFVSPWATPVVLVLYAVVSVNELRLDRSADGKPSSDTVNHD